MRIRWMNFLKVLFFIVLPACMFVFQPGAAHAQTTPCNIVISKSALPADGTVFTFFLLNDVVALPFPLANGESKDIGIVVDDEVDIVEAELPEGWEFAGVRCNEFGDFAITEIENGVRLTCLSIASEVECTFFNRGPANIPTLSEWGMIAAVAGLMMVGVYFAVRRRKAFNS